LAVLTPTPATAEISDQTTVGATSLAKPVAGGRYIFVSTNGTDTHAEYKAWMNEGRGGNREYSRLSCLTNPDWATTTSQEECPEPSREQPLRTVKLAIRAAQPGDVVVVRAGVYTEVAGYGARGGSSSRPIIMQAMPRERVIVSGGLLLKGANYWTVYGMRFAYNAAINTNQSVVGISGGSGWRFLNNEVRGSTGVANILVNSLRPSSTSLAAKQAAAPNNFLIRGNAIHTQAGKGIHGQHHNIYLMSTIYSSGGVIERNLLGHAPRGAHIKAAAANAATADQSPRNVIIRYNTMLYSASGVTIGLKATGIVVEHNIIAYSVNETQYDGGVKTYQLEKPGSNAVRDNLVSGYRSVIEEDGGATPIFNRRNATNAIYFTGKVETFDASPTNSTLRSTYGREAANY
jgi:hypothetical protein